MANYDSPSPSRSPPPADGRDLQHASMSDLLLHLRRTANDRPADGHSRHRQQQQMDVIKIDMDHVIRKPDGTTSNSKAVLCVYKPDGTTSKSMILVCNSHPSEHAYPRRATNATTPYRRTEHHERRRQRSPALHDSDQQVATKVVCLAKMISPGDRLGDDGFYRDILEDITKEARKFGDLLKVVIPRPVPGAAPVVAGVGKVFLEYAHLDDAARCRRRLDGRRFSGKKIAATFFSQDRFAAGDYG